MKKNFTAILKSMTAGATAILLCVLAVMPSFAFGVSPYPGSRAYGAAPLAKSSVLQLESLRVDVDVDLPPEPKRQDSTESVWKHYSVVGSTYALYNPTDERVCEVMAIPLCKEPDYTSGDEPLEAVLPYEGAYSITFKGQSVEAGVRHTLAKYPQRDDTREPMWTGAYDEETLPAQVYLTDEMFYPEQTVTVYTYQVSNPDGCSPVDFRLNAKNYPYDKAACVYVESGGRSGGKLTSHAGKHGETFEVYVIGKDIGTLSWEVDPWEGAESDPGNVTVGFEGKRQITFKDLAMQYYDAAYGVSEMDWYNAVYTYFVDGYTNSSGAIPNTLRSHNVYEYLQGWLIFEITLEPGERAELVTLTPAYPDIMNWYAPCVYEYGYDIEGLARFASVGSVELHVHTPGYATVDASSYGSDYSIPKGEYKLIIDHPDPSEEMILFSVCKTKIPFNWIGDTLYSGLGLLLLVLIVLLALFVLAIIGLVKLIRAAILHARVKKLIKTQPNDPPSDPEAD